jgi:hypothetical protein
MFDIKFSISSLFILHDILNLEIFSVDDLFDLIIRLLRGYSYLNDFCNSLFLETLKSCYESHGLILELSSLDSKLYFKLDNSFITSQFRPSYKYCTEFNSPYDYEYIKYTKKVRFAL